MPGLRYLEAQAGHPLGQRGSASLHHADKRKVAFAEERNCPEWDKLKAGM